MIQTALYGMITFMLAKFILNDLPHSAGLLANPNTYDVSSWDKTWISCLQAARILGKELTEQDIPANWPEMRRLHKDLWAQVYAKRQKGKLRIGNPASQTNPTIPAYIMDHMNSILDTISDEVGEEYLDLDHEYLLKYEGWSTICIPSEHWGTEEEMRNYGISESSKVHLEWRAEMLQRGYVEVIEEHDENLGLYGVTYALYRKKLKGGNL